MKIAWDYFPFGAGFGTFGSWMSRAMYSPLYHTYGLSHVWGLSPGKTSFINDIFWPSILAETGIFGLLFYGLIIIGFLRICVQSLKVLNTPLITNICFGRIYAFN